MRKSSLDKEYTIAAGKPTRSRRPPIPCETSSSCALSSKQLFHRNEHQSGVFLWKGDSATRPYFLFSKSEKDHLLLEFVQITADREYSLFHYPFI